VAEIEKLSCGSSESSLFTMVVFPAPDGAEKIKAFPFLVGSGTLKNLASNLGCQSRGYRLTG
ncbi:MAG: hypothetical protein KI791_20120, partial [Cyclobacteriaceae bacterium]|nr:hypothetical protein [Cyclobacteriaceae bacterium SS2]